jgi:hypothetical protein
MKVLLLEHGTTPETAVETELGDAGHAVVRCHEPGQPAFPCRGLRRGGRCPLDGDSVAVAVDVSPARAEYPEHNDGITCALRRSVPVVVTGDLADDAMLELADAVAPRGELVAVVEHAAHAPVLRASEVATDALRDTLTRHGIRGIDASAEVRRDGPSLSVTVDVDAPLTPAVRQAAAVRVLAAVRSLHPHTSKVGVSFRPRSAPGH